jgi:hypothetical protein
MTRCYSSSCHLRYFGLRVLALGEGDVTGEGLAAGLESFTGAVPVGPAGEEEVEGEGRAAFGVFGLFSGSVAQPAANTIENMVRSRSAVRLIRLMLGFFISFPSFQQD